MNRWQRLIENKRARRTALLLALWVPALVVLVVVREVLLPFLLALVLSYVISPLVRRLSSIEVAGRHLPRGGAVVVLYLGLALVLWVFGAVLVPQLYREAKHLAAESARVVNSLDDDDIARWSRDAEAFFERYQVPIQIVTDEDATETTEESTTLRLNVAEAFQGIVHDVRTAVAERRTALLGQVQALVTYVIRLVFQTFLVLMLTAFITADSQRIFTFLFSLTPVRDRERLSELLDRIDGGLSGVVRGQLTICLVNGALTLVGLLLLKVKFAFLLATVAAVLSLVPIFGSILSTVPIVIVGLSSGVSTAVLALLWIIGIHLLEANLLNPKILGDAAKIHPALVVLALVVGEHFYGFVGALLAVPIMSILVTVFRAARARAMALDEEIAHEPSRDGKRRVTLKRAHDSG